jgi:hypothetical protein
MNGIPHLPGLWPHVVAQGRSAERAGDTAAAKADTVDRRLDRALLTMEAMWTLLRERLQVTDEQLAQRIVELDESDGLLDGRVRRKTKSCPHCQKTIPGRFPRCLYCGEAVPVDPFA